LEEGLRLQGSPLHVTLHQLEDCVNRIAIQDSLAVLGGDQCLKETFQTASAEQDQCILQSAAQELKIMLQSQFLL
jgi:hypothetical protein